MGHPREQLDQDHALLRAKMALAKSILEREEAVTFELVQVCTSLVEDLRHHVAREDKLLAHGSQAANALQELSAPPVKHYAEWRQLHMISRMLLRQSVLSVAWLKRMLGRALEDLARTMRQQEEGLFPALERALHPRKPSWSELVETESALSILELEAEMDSVPTR